jgi:hypothetical protein
MTNYPPVQRYRFFWLSGMVSEGEGYDVADAFRRLGYGGGALRALDYYEQIDGQAEQENSDE